MSDPILYRDSVAAGGTWSAVVKRHQVLRITDTAGGGNVSALFYNERDPLERYNMPDTLKAQYTAFLSKGRTIMSDMGRALCSIVEDTCGWHDTLCGHSDEAIVTARYGAKTYQDARNDRHRNGRDNFLVELGKHGLGKQDLVPCVNFFSKVVTDDEGKFAFVPGNAAPGAHVELRFEMDVLVVLTAVQHPLDPSPVYAPRAAELTVRQGPPPGPDDPCRIARAETRRAFENSERYFL
jgi:urea carboxylase-associated protein 2